MRLFHQRVSDLNIFYWLLFRQRQLRVPLCFSLFVPSSRSPKKFFKVLRWSVGIKLITNFLNSYRSTSHYVFNFLKTYKLFLLVWNNLWFLTFKKYLCVLGNLFVFFFWFWQISFFNFWSFLKNIFCHKTENGCIDDLLDTAKKKSVLWYMN